MRRRIEAALLCCCAAWVWAGCGELPDDLDGQDIPDVRFTGPLPQWISWSKQSDAIAYEQSGRLVAARGDDLKDARAVTGYGEYAHPSWSPDGRWIVHDRPSGAFGGEDIWARSATNDALPLRFTDSVYRDSMPAWSADGDWIAFHSRRNPAGHVWMVSSKGDGSDPTPVAPALSQEDSLDWSPTGSRLAFVAFVDDSVDIWVVDGPYGEAFRLGGTPASDRQPRWRPDGGAVGFIAGSGAGAEVWMTEDRPGASAQKLTDGAGASRFYWLMGGDAVAYLNNDGQLWAVMLDGSASVHLRDTVDFAASPDGRRYAYVERVGNVYRHYADVFPTEFLLTP